jgi:hypothetical protein
MAVKEWWRALLIWLAVYAFVALVFGLFNEAAPR